MNIYVGNLPYRMTERELSEAFERFGNVSSARIITDRDTGRSKGFGFVDMSDQQEAEEAIRSLDGSDLGGRSIKVNEARPRQPRN
jgi:RNA recognition motif-containing protein